MWKRRELLAGCNDHSNFMSTSTTATTAAFLLPVPALAVNLQQIIKLACAVNKATNLQLKS